MFCITPWSENHSVHPSLSAGGRGRGGAEPPTKFLRGLPGSQFWEEGCWERGGGGDKKPYKVKMFISVITKKNPVTFKRWDEVKDEKF